MPIAPDLVEELVGLASRNGLGADDHLWYDGGRMETLAKALGHSSIRTTVDLYAHLATEDVAADLARVIAARESRLRDQSVPRTRMNKREEAPSGFEPLYEALQASA